MVGVDRSAQQGVATKHPLVKMTVELVERFVEFWEFDVNEFKLFVEDFGTLIFEFDNMETGVVGFMIVKNKIENSDGIDGA